MINVIDQPSWESDERNLFKQKPPSGERGNSDSGLREHNKTLGT